MFVYEFVCVSNVGILNDLLSKFALEISRMLNLMLIYEKYFSSVFVSKCKLCIGILSDFRFRAEFYNSDC